MPLDPASAFRLDGEIALITGGGSGLGLGMARAMHGAGAQVVLVGRRPDMIRSAAEELGEGDADEEEYAETPPLQGYDGREGHRHHDTRDDGDDTVESADEQGHRSHLHDQHRGQWREQRLGAREED